ncbi:conserved hypothetical protein [Thiocapsa sp. KS1]|nr:hypothetical protein [Thiocapsa sp. KS1]CRI67875.1 conserved hypothetical protein [Thiocapsa sp. KS1]
MGKKGKPNKKSQSQKIGSVSASAGQTQKGGTSQAAASPSPKNPPTNFYLRVEGLNIGAVIGDTDQLSVARGASFLLREAIHDVQSMLPDNTDVVSAGASIGECLLPGMDQARVDTVVSDIGNVLNNTTKPYRHLSFGVCAEGYTPSSGEIAVRERALARIRFGQMRSPTCVMPAENQDPSLDVCAWEGRRAADAAKPVRRDGEEDIHVSASVWDRWRRGVDRKQGFYRDEANLTPQHPAYGFGYSRDLGDLARESRAGNLNGKVAVIYADGNRFSRIREEICRTFKLLKDFDTTIRNRRSAYLSDLLEVMAGDDRFQMSDSDGKRRLRLETLLWGGDELLLVVPAWCGFDVVQHLFTSFEGWQHGRLNLTHSVGLVFCRAKTPIQRSMTLARQLADGVKDRLKAQATGRDEAQRLASQLKNRFDYMALESVDFPVEGDLTEFFARRYASVLSIRRDLTPDPSWVQSRTGLAVFLNQFPKAQAYRVSRAAVASNWGSQAPDVTAYRKAIERMVAVTRGRGLDDASAVLDGVFNAAAQLKIDGAEIPDPWAWIHLVELWDYLCPTLAEMAQPAAVVAAPVAGDVP